MGGGGTWVRGLFLAAPALTPEKMRRVLVLLHRAGGGKSRKSERREPMRRDLDWSLKRPVRRGKDGSRGPMVRRGAGRRGASTGGSRRAVGSRLRSATSGRGFMCRTRGGGGLVGLGGAGQSRCAFG